MKASWMAETGKWDKSANSASVPVTILMQPQHPKSKCVCVFVFVRKTLNGLNTKGELI